jgi:hypothetical protein
MNTITFIFKQTCLLCCFLNLIVCNNFILIYLCIELVCLDLEGFSLNSVKFGNILEHIPCLIKPLVFIQEPWTFRDELHYHYDGDGHTQIEQMEVKPIVAEVVINRLEDHCRSINTVNACHRDHMIPFRHELSLVHSSYHISASCAKTNEQVVADSPINVFGPDDQSVSACLNNKTESVGSLAPIPVSKSWSHSC